MRPSILHPPIQLVAELDKRVGCGSTVSGRGDLRRRLRSVRLALARDTFLKKRTGKFFVSRFLLTPRNLVQNFLHLLLGKPLQQRLGFL
jgi:hypothetical protein